MVIIGTRASKADIKRAEYLQQKLKEFTVDSEIVPLKLRAYIENDPTSTAEDKQKRIIDRMEEALFDNEIDVAVYPMEVLSTKRTKGVQIAGVSARMDAKELLLSLDDSILVNGPLSLKDGFRVGASTPLRLELLNHYFTNIQIQRTEGEAEEQIEQLLNGELDALMIDKASVDFIKFDEKEIHVRELSPREFIPAPAQGVLAFQCRSEDKNMIKVLSMIHQAESSELTNVERSVLKELEDEKDLILGAYCERSGLNYRLHAAYKSSKNPELKIVRSIHPATTEIADYVMTQLKTELTDAD